MSLLFALAIGYVVGSVDFAVIVSRARGVDIYAEGSGNPGASNVMRTIGKGAAALVLIGDAVKGIAAAAIGLALVGDLAGAAAGGFAAVLGHCFPVLHRFKGGKGVATSIGAFIIVFGWWSLAMIALWGAIVALTRKASLGSLLVMGAVVPAAWLIGLAGSTLAWLAAIVVLVFVRHRGNLARLLAGEERAVVAE